MRTTFGYKQKKQNPKKPLNLLKIFLSGDVERMGPHEVWHKHPMVGLSSAGVSCVKILFRQYRFPCPFLPIC